MKKIIISILIISTSLLYGCNDWLDINPSSETKADQLFENESGYKAALTGVYVKLATSSLYGKSTGYHFPDLITQHWRVNDSAGSSIIGSFTDFNYSNRAAETALSNTWLAYYNAIVQLNDILEHLADTDVNFNFGNRELIEGEALGLRGLLHLEVLRLFGPIPSDAGSSTVAIPYLESVTKNVSELVSKSYGEVTANILRDLKRAEELLSGDPITSCPNSVLNRFITNADNLPQDSWQWYRQNRMNLYAVKGALARYHMWTGNTREAIEYAGQVIDATVSSTGADVFYLANSTYLSSDEANLVFGCEHLFGVHNPDLQSIVRARFVGPYETGTDFLTQTYEAVNDLFYGGAYMNASDIRSYSRYWTNYTAGTTLVPNYLKYVDTDNFPSPNVVPVLRLAEMYLIMVEALSDIEDAREYFITFQQERGMDPGYSQDYFSATTRREVLEREYLKEFYGEAQSFFYFKRNKYTSFSWPEYRAIDPTAVFVLPIPTSQSSFQ